MAILAEDLWVQGNPSPAEQIALLEFQKRLTHKWLLSLQYHTEAIDVDHVKEAFPSTWSPIATSPGHIMKYYLGHRLASAYALHGLPEGITPNLTQIFETLAPTTGLFLLPHVLVVDDPTNISLNALLGGRPPLSVLLTQALQPPLERPRQDTSAAVKSVLP
jgi:hypothetical protein